MSKIDLVTESFISNGYHALARYLELPVALACTLLIVLLGYGMLTGIIEMSIKTFNETLFSIGAVYTFAFGWANFNDYFIALFFKGADELSSVLINGNLFEIPLLTKTGAGLKAALQTVLIEAVKVGGWAMAKGGLTDLIPFIIGLSFIIGGSIVVSLACIEIIVVKLYLAMLLAVGPFFISCYLFPQAKAQFAGWLTQLKGFALALILLGVASSLCMYLMHWVVGGYFIDRAVGITLYSIVPLIIASLLCILLLTGIIPIAKQIGGAQGSSGWGAVGGAIAGLGAGMISTPMKGIKSMQAISHLSKSITPMSQQTFSNIRSQLQRGR